MTAGLLETSALRIAAEEPQLSSTGLQTWVVRAANFVVASSAVEPGVGVEGTSEEEWIAIVHPDSSFAVRAGDEKADVAVLSVVVVPPGSYSFTAVGAGRLSRVLPVSSAPELAAAAGNAERYATLPANTAPLEPWPMPIDGYRLRVYAVDDYPVQDGILGRIFRSRNFMVNVFPVRTEPRPQLSPHSHDDHEQCSLSLSGDFVHHARYPWTPDKSVWHEDEHIALGSPSAVVFPTQVIHTSETVGASRNWQLVDIFGPPRLDFSRKPGFVRNAAEYPMPLPDGE